MGDRTLKQIRDDRRDSWVAGEPLQVWQIMDFDALLAEIDAPQPQDEILPSSYHGPSEEDPLEHDEPSVPWSRPEMGQAIVDNRKAITDLERRLAAADIP